MEEQPQKGKTLTAVLVSVITATVVSAAVALVVPEIPTFAIISAWVGTAFTLAIWFLIYR